MGDRIRTLDRVSLSDRLARTVPILGIYFLIDYAKKAFEIARDNDQAFAEMMEEHVQAGMDIDFSALIGHSVKHEKWMLATISFSLLFGWSFISVFVIFYKMSFWQAVLISQLIALAIDYTSCSIVRALFSKIEGKKVPRLGTIKWRE